MSTVNHDFVDITCEAAACSYIQVHAVVRECGEGPKHTQKCVTNIHCTSATTHAKCNKHYLLTEVTGVRKPTSMQLQHSVRRQLVDLEFKMKSKLFSTCLENSAVLSYL